MSARPPRYEYYDEEDGYVISGTHDIAAALRILETATDVTPAYLLDACLPARKRWMHKVPAERTPHGFRWHAEFHKEPKRGATPVVYWPRKW